MPTYCIKYNNFDLNNCEVYVFKNVYKNIFKK